MAKIGKWLATLICLALLVVVAAISINYRGISELKADIPSAVGEVGGRLPDFTLPDVTGNPVTLSQFQGKGRVVLTFDRSVDW